MKKIFYLVAAGVIALCTACSSENEPVIEPKPDPVKPDKPTTDDEPVEASYLHLSQPEKSVVDGLTAFSDKLIDMSAEYTDKEEFNVSPLSVSMYLDLLANSCQGDTRSGILAALGLSDIDALNGVCKRLLDYLPSDGTGAKMHIANHIWVSQRYTVPATFKSRIAAVFGDVVESVDFTQPTTVPAINKWVSDNTNGLIPEMFGGDWKQYVSTRIAKANAVYFMGKWMQEFDPSETTRQVFHATQTDAQVDMMHRTAMLVYAKNDVAEKVVLDFTGQVNSLEIYLPVSNTPAKGIPALINSEVRNSMAGTISEVALSLPRFSVTSDLGLNSVLSALGITLDGVDLSPVGINERLPMDVKQKTVMKVDEKGAELAALTSSIATSPGDEPTIKKVTMTVDRPFMYIVRNNETKAILMAGVVANPK